MPNEDPQGFNYISPVRFWVQKVLPLVYDDSLSYYEVLSKVVLKLNEIIEIVNPIGAGIEGTINEYLSKFKVEWEAELATFQSTVNATITQNNQVLNQRIDTLTADVTSQIQQSSQANAAQIKALEAKVLQQIATLAVTISDTDTANRTWTTAQLNALKTQLTQNYPPVIDPTTGELSSVQTALNHIWDSIRENALTASEYDALQLTAQEYDAKQLTAMQYDNFGKLLLEPDNTDIYLGGLPIKKSIIDMEALKNGII